VREEKKGPKKEIQYTPDCAQIDLWDEGCCIPVSEAHRMPEYLRRCDPKKYAKVVGSDLLLIVVI